VAGPLIAAGAPALTAQADAPSVGKAAMVLTLGKYRVGPRAGFRGDVDRGVNGSTGIVKIAVASGTVLNSIVVKVNEGGGFPIYRDFNASDGFALYKDLNGNGRLDPADYEAGTVSQPGYGVSGDGTNALVTVNGDPAKATGTENYLLTVHPADGAFSDRPVTFTVDANALSTSAGALPASPVVVDNAVIDSQAPVAIPSTQFAPQSRIPTVVCPAPAPSLGCGNDGYKVYLGGVPTEDGEKLAFFNSASDLSDAALLVVPDGPSTSHAAIYDAAGLPDAQVQAAELSIGNGTGRDASVAGSRALNNQTSDTVYAVQWDLMGNTSTVTLTSDRCLQGSPGCSPVLTPLLGNDVTGPKPTSYSITLGNITAASDESAVTARGSITGVDSAVPANNPQAPVKQLARLQQVTQTSASPPAYHVETDGEEKYSAADATPAAGTVTIDTILNASDDTDFPESELLRAVGRLVDATGNVAMSATSNPPALKDTVPPSFVSISLIDADSDGVSDPGEEFRVIFNDPIDPAKVGALDTDLKPTKVGGTCSAPTTTTDCITWGNGATKVWSSQNRILTITLGQRSCNVSGVGPSCPGGFANRLPTAGDTVTASTTVADPVGNGIANPGRAIVIGPPFVLPYTASTVDTLLPSNVNVFGTNRDGILDAVDVKFTGALNTGSVTTASDAGKFKVAVPGDEVTATAAVVGGSGNTIIRLSFTRTAGKDSLWNTGAKPVVKLLSGSGLQSSTSQVIAPFELTSEDKVAPVPVSLKTQDASPAAPDSHLDHVIVQYSEPIKQGVENPCGYRVVGYTQPTYSPPNASTTPGPSTCPTTPSGVGRNKPSPIPAGATVSDTVSLELKPVTGFDTDVTPLVEFNATNQLPPYTGPGSGPNNTNGPECDTNASLTATSTPNCPVVDADGNALPFFTGIALDAVGPTIVTRETADTNGDGKIDEIRIGFGEAFSTPSIGAALFTISEPTFTISSVSATSDRILAVRVVPTDSRKGDSGVTPKVAFLGGTTDTVDPPNASPTDAGVVVTDKAGPAIVGACVAMPTATTPAKLGTCPTGTGNKMAVLMSETLDTAAANVAAADFVVEQPLGTVKAVTAVSLANGTGADAKGVVTLTFADNALDYTQNAFVRFSGTGVVTDNVAATPKNANTQTANVIAFGAPTVSLDLTCPIAANPGYCSATSINTGATGTPGVTAWRLTDTGSSTVPPAAPTAADFTATRPSTFPPPGVVLTEGTHNLWLTGKDDFDRITDDATDSIVILKPPKIENVQWVNATPAKAQAWSKTDTVLDGDGISIGADMYGTDAADWATAPVGGGCKAANLSADLRSLTGNSTKGAVAPNKCDLKTNTAPPFRQAQWTGITAQGTTKYPVGTVLKITANDPGSLVVDGPSGTLLRRPFISVNARRSWQITDASVIQVPIAVVNGIPKGAALAYRDGSIVKGTNTGYYYVSSNVKRPVSTATLAYFRIPTTTAYAVTPAELTAMPTLGGIGGGSFHPVGVWIKFTNGSIQQVVRNGSGTVVRRAVANAGALKTLVPASQIFPANAKDSTLPLDSFQRGYRDGTLLRLAGGTYGVVSRSSLRRFANPATFNSLGYATGNAISANGGAMPHVAAQPYRNGTAIDRYKITTIVVKVTNGAGASASATLKPSVGGIYGVGTLDPVPVGWDTSWM
jgi:hypothetical protein